MRDRSVAVRLWIARPPAWLRIHPLIPSDAEFMALWIAVSGKPYNWPWNNTRMPLIMTNGKVERLFIGRGLPLIGRWAPWVMLITRD